MSNRHGLRPEELKSPEQLGREYVRGQKTISNLTQRADLHSSVLAALQREITNARNAGIPLVRLPAVHGQMSPQDAQSAMRQINVAMGRPPEHDFINNPSSPQPGVQPQGQSASQPQAAPSAAQPTRPPPENVFDRVAGPGPTGNAITPPSLAPQLTPAQAAQRESLKLAVAAGVGRNAGGRVIDRETLTQGVLDPAVQAARANPAVAQNVQYGTIGGAGKPAPTGPVTQPKLPGASVAPPPAAPGTMGNPGMPSRTQMTESAKPTMGVGTIPGPTLAPSPAAPFGPSVSAATQFGQTMRTGLDSLTDSASKTLDKAGRGIGAVVNAPSQAFQGFTATPAPLPKAEPPSMPVPAPAADPEEEKRRRALTLAGQ